MILRSGMMPVVVGIVAGLGLAWVAGGVIRGLLYGIATTDFVTYAGVAVVLGAAGMIAAYLPARRAARVDPLTALRDG
jgi:putative ABC transport system permease protein